MQVMIGRTFPKVIARDENATTTTCTMRSSLKLFPPNPSMVKAACCLSLIHI